MSVSPRSRLALVLSACVLLAAVPLGAAQDVDPTSSPNRVFDPTTTKTVLGTAYAITLDGTLGGITFNSSYDVTFTNLAESGTYTLGVPGGPTAFASTATDNAHPGRYNVTFPATDIGATTPAPGKFNAVGDWVLTLSGVGETARILVNATNNLAVTLSPSTVTESTTEVTLTITVSDESTRAPVAGATVTGFGATLGTTNDEGQLTISWPTPEPGFHEIVASKSIAGDDAPEFIGRTHLEVLPYDSSMSPEHSKLAAAIGDVMAAVTALRESMGAGFDRVSSKLSDGVHGILARLDVLEARLHARFNGLDHEVAALREDVRRLGSSHDVGVQLATERENAILGTPPPIIALVTVDGVAADASGFAVTVDGVAVDATVEAIGVGTYRVTLPTTDPLPSPGTHVVVVEASVDVHDGTFRGSGLATYRL